MVSMNPYVEPRFTDVILTVDMGLGGCPCIYLRKRSNILYCMTLIRVIVYMDPFEQVSDMASA
jgi:hypothetical protein